MNSALNLGLNKVRAQDEGVRRPLFQYEIAKFFLTTITKIVEEDQEDTSERCSKTTLRAKLHDNYKELTRGGENFNHEEIIPNMSSDPTLWTIDSKDRATYKGMRVPQKKVCKYCNKTNHCEKSCRMKPPVCYMCGSVGHTATCCPNSVCVNCGSPKKIYSPTCRICSNWNSIVCMECKQNGPPSNHCPDLWRRYHNTLDLNVPLTENGRVKIKQNIYCSGCAQSGHSIHQCRISKHCSNLPIYSPYVFSYRPVLFTKISDKPVSRRSEKRSRHEEDHELTLASKRACLQEIKSRNKKSIVY